MKLRVGLFMVVALTLGGCVSVFAAELPNIVFILADDLGYGDLGCYGQQKIKTPSVDTLAGEGLRFTRHYSGNNVCAPSRATLMTGMHPGHCVIRNNMEVQPEGQMSMPEGTVTLVGELKKLGYVSGAFGKWGLGAPDSVSSPLRVGFDRFYGYNCQRVAHSYYPEFLWDDDQRVVVNKTTIPGHAPLDTGADPNDPNSYLKFQGENYSADLIADEVMRFVGNHVENNADQPFFLYWPTTVPHLALQVPDDSLKEYQGLWDDPPYPGDNGYTPQFTPRAAYAAMVTRLDREVGRLVQLLKDKGVYENTIIIFSSDNGPLWDRFAGTDSEFFNSHGGLRGRKGGMYEGGIRVPCIVSWPGKIQPETITDRMSGFEDWFPTLLEIAGVTPHEQQPCDGFSLVPLLLGEKSDRPVREWLYRESPGYGGQQTVMLGDWKALRIDWATAKRTGKTIDDVPVELYNLKDDPAEENNVAAKYPEKARELRELMEREHVPSSGFPMPLLDD